MKNFYLKSSKNQIFISHYPLNNIQVDENDVIILICNKSIKTQELIQFKKNCNFYKQCLILCNTPEEKNLCDKQKIYSSFINKNCFIDESIFHIKENINKEYDGIYATSIKERKRLYLLKDIPKIAILKNFNQEEHKHLNVENLNIINNSIINKEEICEYYNKALFGCIFSIQDCSSSVSCEYMLCGLPVLTTRSSGGRNIWYNKYNHILIEPNQNSLKEAINLCKERIQKGIFNSELIRRNQIKLMLNFRLKFNKLISQLTNLELEECIDKFNENFKLLQ